jgi:DNA-binding beta-propeller fold protein YncE
MDRRAFVLAAGGIAASAVQAPSALAARLGGVPVAYVTADLESHVVVLELETAAVVTRIRTGPRPRSIESIQSRIAVVAHTDDGVVTLLDAATHRVRREVDGLAEPRYTAVHPRRRALVYITDSAREEVVVLNAERGRILARVAVPGPARHICVSRDGRTLWTALGTAAARVAVLDTSDPTRPKLRRTFAAPFLAHDVGFAPDGTLWVSSGTEPRIALYRRGRLQRILETGASPQHVTFARSRAFVACGDDGSVARHRLDGALVRDARVPVGSYNVTFGWEHVVSPSLGRGTVSVLDVNGRVRAVRQVARAAHDACIVYGP